MRAHAPKLAQVQKQTTQTPTNTQNHTHVQNQSRRAVRWTDLHPSTHPSVQTLHTFIIVCVVDRFSGLFPRRAYRTSCSSIEPTRRLNAPIRTMLSCKLASIAKIMSSAKVCCTEVNFADELTSRTTSTKELLRVA